jgi:hypothetical protein
MSFYTPHPYPLFVYDYNLVDEEIFFGIPFRFCIWKSGIMGCTYMSIRMDRTYTDYDEEFAAFDFEPYRKAFRYFDTNNDLISLRLDTIRFAYQVSLKNQLIPL